jgi:hypothetical protein
LRKRFEIEFSYVNTFKIRFSNRGPTRPLRGMILTNLSESFGMNLSFSGPVVLERYFSPETLVQRSSGQICKKKPPDAVQIEIS